MTSSATVMAIAASDTWGSPPLLFHWSVLFAFLYSTSSPFTSDHLMTTAFPLTLQKLDSTILNNRTLILLMNTLSLGEGTCLKVTAIKQELGCQSGNSDSSLGTSCTPFIHIHFPMTPYYKKCDFMIETDNICYVLVA